MLNDTQLDNVKLELQSHRTIRDIVTNDHPEEKVDDVIKQLVTKFGQQQTAVLIRTAALYNVPIDRLNQQVSRLQARSSKYNARYDFVKTIRDDRIS